jgi:hypothetical protein
VALDRRTSSHGATASSCDRATVGQDLAADGGQTIV